MSLPIEEIQRLLNKPETPKPRKYPIPVQNGPLRFYDREMRCASRRCGSPTHMKVEGISYCNMHALRRLNELVVELTELRRKDLMA
jgi:hypothetical protein